MSRFFVPDEDLDAGKPQVLPGGVSFARIWTGHQWASVNGVQVKLQEEASLDDELYHKSEALDVLVIGDQVFAQQVTSEGSDTTAPRRR